MQQILSRVQTTFGEVERRVTYFSFNFTATGRSVYP